MLSLQGFAASSAAAAKIMQSAQINVQDCLTALPPLVETATSKQSTDEKRLTAWRSVMAADPTAVEARVRVAGAEIQRAARKRDSGEAASAATMVMPLLPLLRECHSDLHAHAAASKLDLSSLVHSSSPLALIDHRWPNVAFVLLQASSFQPRERPVWSSTTREASHSRGSGAQ